MATKINLYEVLGLTRENANERTIKMAYKSLALKWHPDKNTGNEEQAKEVFREISEAYQVLSDPRKKAEYDRSLDYNGPGGFLRRSGGFSFGSGVMSPKELFDHFFRELDADLMSPYTNGFGVSHRRDPLSASFGGFGGGMFPFANGFADSPTGLSGMSTYFETSETMRDDQDRVVERKTIVKNGVEIEELYVNQMLTRRIVDGVEQDIQRISNH